MPTATLTTAKSTRTPKPSTTRADDIKAVAAFFRMLGDPTRVAILATIEAAEIDVNGLCAVVGMDQPAVSHHLTPMRLAGFVTKRRAGKSNLYSLSAKKGRLAAAMIRKAMS